MVVSQGDKLLVGLLVTEYWMLIGRGRGVGYNRETSVPNFIEIVERFCIPFYGIFKTESLSDRVRVRPAALRRWLWTKTVLHFVGRFGGFV